MRRHPLELARLALERLEECADSRTAAKARTFFKPGEMVHFFGVKSPKLRQIELELFRNVRSSWNLDEALRFCDILVRDPHVEAKSLGLLLLSRYKRSFGPDLLRKAKSWLDTNCCNNWSLTDAISPWILAPLIEQHPHLVEEVKLWSRSRNLWVRRAALVAFVPLARRGKSLDAAYEIAESSFGDREDLTHKAAGWLLREAGKTDASRLESFLLARGARIPRTTLRYAIERFPETKRKVLLNNTKTGK